MPTVEAMENRMLAVRKELNETKQKRAII